eukprot:167231-Alexandrium_andersonii.AAC.1
MLRNWSESVGTCRTQRESAGTGKNLLEPVDIYLNPPETRASPLESVHIHQRPRGPRQSAAVRQ